MTDYGAQAAELLYALRTVMGDADHGQNMTWDERLMIGRKAIDKAIGRPEWKENDGL